VRGHWVTRAVTLGLSATVGAALPAVSHRLSPEAALPAPLLGALIGVGVAFGHVWMVTHRVDRAVRRTGAELIEEITTISETALAPSAPAVAATSLDGGALLAVPRQRSAIDTERLEQALSRLLVAARTGGASTGSSGPGEPAADVSVMLGRDGRIGAASGAWAGLLGVPGGELVGQPLAGLVHAGDLEAFGDLVDSALIGTADPQARVRTRIRGGGQDWQVIEWIAAPVDGDRDPDAVVLAGRDVSAQARVEADMLHQAMYDTLTGLPNRTALLQLARDWVAAATEAEQLSVLVIDLDRFKDVNDSLGHAIGDQLLAQVGPRLRSALRPTDTIARLGGDEFAVLLPAAGEEGARQVAERLAEAMDSPFTVDGMDLHVEASIGIAISHQPDRAETATVEGLMREADIAMYRAKDEGSGIVLFDPEKDAVQGRQRLKLSAELRRGIAEGQLVVYYQPCVDVVEGRLAGVEALVRWQHPERGVLPPGAFLPLAEQTGLIIPLSKQVLAMAIAQASAWRQAGGPIQVAVNLSPRWLQHADVPQIVAAMVQEYQLPTELLRLEITESVVLAQPEHALGMLNQLREMGIGLSLDDFGTGYSSMTHLRSLPVDELKVDRGFVQAMVASPQDAVIVRAAIELGHNLGMDVVAEGIEDADTLAEVVSAGCSLAQGYYFARPLPAAELVPWAQERFPDFGTPEGGPATRRQRD
jgi:diguanylate cyclase (GGDEF)-like protein